MDLCITAEEPFQQHSSKPKPFSPVARSQIALIATPSPHHLHPRASSSPASPETPLNSDEKHKFLDFELVIYDEANTNDSMLTHPWDVQATPLRIPLDTSKAKLLSLLRMHLPLPSPCNLSAPSTDLTLAQYRSRTAGPIRRPKLIAVTLYWTFRGDILPLGEDDEDWHYRNPITKTDLVCRSESEWFLLREMMAASNGALKCYLAIRGEALPASAPKKLGGYGWLFGSNRKTGEEKRTAE